MIKLIWAQTNEGVIGRDNQLPWAIPAEMQHFKRTTQHATILMGRKTFESLGCKALPQRTNYVLTTNPAKYHQWSKVLLIDDFSPLIKQFQAHPHEHLFVIGGVEVLRQCLAFADEIIKTTINHNYAGNVYIDRFNLSNFDKIKTIEHQEFKIEYFTRRQNEQTN